MPYRYDDTATNGDHEIFETPANEFGSWWQGPATSWPASSLSTTSVEQVKNMAELQQKQDRLTEVPIEAASRDWQDDVPLEGVADSSPRMMEFFNGRPYEEGRAAYNQHRMRNGLPPIREGRR